MPSTSKRKRSASPHDEVDKPSSHRQSDLPCVGSLTATTMTDTVADALSDSTGLEPTPARIKPMSTEALKAFNAKVDRSGCGETILL